MRLINFPGPSTCRADVDIKLHSFSRLSFSYDTVEGILDNESKRCLSHLLMTNRASSRYRRMRTQWTRAAKPSWSLGSFHIQFYKPRIFWSIGSNGPVTARKVTDCCRATHVPVGEDQSQHLEFARECATNFNHTYQPHLIAPQTILCMSSKQFLS